MKDKQQVGADAADGAGDGILRALANRQHGNDCADADDNAQNGQAGAQFVGAQAFQGFENGLSEVHAVASIDQPIAQTDDALGLLANFGIMGDDDDGGACVRG